MKFSVASRDVELGLIHVIYVLAVRILLVLALALVLVAATYATTGGFSFEDFLVINLDIIGVFSLVSAPLLAFLLLRFSGTVKLKNDVALCRSLAAGGAAISIGLWLLGILASLAVGMIIAETAASSAIASAGKLLSVLAGSVVMYLWLLFFLQPGKQKAGETAVRAGIFAVFYFIIQGVAVVLVSNAAGNLEAVRLDYEGIRFILTNFMFAFPLLYNMKEKEDRRAYMLFAALFIGAALLYGISSLVRYEGWSWSWAVGTVESIVELSIIYALSKKDILKTF